MRPSAGGRHSGAMEDADRRRDHCPALPRTAREVLTRRALAVTSERRPPGAFVSATTREEETMSTPRPDFDEARAEAFAGRLFELYTGGMLTYMIDLGHRTGLFDAAAEGPATSEALAARAGLRERYVLN